MRRFVPVWIVADPAALGLHHPNEARAGTTDTGESSDGYGFDACAKLASEPATAKAATMRTLAAVLCAWEETSGVHTWRGPSAWDARIMNALIGWGYEPSDVERILIGVDTTADDVEEPAPVDAIDTTQAA